MNPNNNIRDICRAVRSCSHLRQKKGFVYSVREKHDRQLILITDWRDRTVGNRRAEPDDPDSGSNTVGKVPLTA